MHSCFKSTIIVSKILVLTLLFVLCEAVTHGAPLKNVPITLTQPGGKTLQCFASGDEHYNWLHDKNNFTIVQDPKSGYFVYAQLVNDELRATELVAGVANPRLEGLTPGVNYSAEKIARIRNERIERRRDDLMRHLGGKTGRGTLMGIPKVPAAPSMGTLNNIVIFIRFAGESEFTDQVSFYNGLFNASGPTSSSMYNYFKDASYNQLNITTTFYPVPPGTTVVSYQDSYTRAYYQPYNATTNPIGYQNGTEAAWREHTLLKNACAAIASQIPSGLNLDADNDGYVDNVCFIVSGSPGNWADLLWPHMWVLYLYDVRLNGKRVWTYNFQLQSWMDVGVLCHEMGHSIGLPDLYHYSGNGINPVYTWDLMEYQQNPPQHMGAYMKKRYLNWIAPIPEITTSGTYTLNPLTTQTGNCYKIKSPNSTTEYFIVEYRKRVGIFESSISGEGLIVYRINTVADGQGNAGGPPDEVYIYRPGGTNSANGSPWIANFSSNVGRTAINDATNPSSFLSNGGPGGLNIYNITSVGNTISFDIGFYNNNNCTLLCPSNITTATTLNQCGANVTYPAPYSTSACGTVVCTPSSGSFFTKGTTTVNCLSASGSSCAFTVTVNDVQAPSITCPANIAVESDASCSGATVSYSNPSVSDNCPGSYLVGCSPTSGSYFGVGVNPVTCTARDAVNNTSTCTFNVTVESRVRIAIGNGQVNVGVGCKATASITKSIPVLNSGGHASGGIMQWTATTTASDITILTPSGTEGQNLSFKVNPSGLSAGTYTRTITITAKNSVTNAPACNSPMTLNVVIQVEPQAIVSQTKAVGTTGFTTFTNSAGHAIADVKSNTAPVTSFTVNMEPCTYPNGMTRLRYVKRKYSFATNATQRNFDIRLYFTDTEAALIPNPGLITMYQQAAVGGAWSNLGGTVDLTMNSVMRSGITNINGVFALAAPWTPKALPLNVVSAFYDSETQNVVIQWTTPTIPNLHGFSIERTAAGQNDAWELVGRVGYNSSTQYGFSERVIPSEKYLYRISVMDEGGDVFESEPFLIEALDPEPSFTLSQSFPNPVQVGNTHATIRFSIDQPGRISIRLFDLLGRQVRVLLNEERRGGEHVISIDASNLPAGAYIYRLECAGKAASKPLMIVK